MKIDGKNIIVGDKIGDLIGGLISLGLSIFLIVQMDDTEKWTVWLMALFLGLGSIVILWKFVNPKNKFVSPKSEIAKKIRQEELKANFNTDGIFVYRENGFELLIDKKLTKINWDEILQLIGYKIDALTTDEICLYVLCKNGKSFEISESSKGWFEFNKRLKDNISSLNKNWEIEIAHPPFERNQTELYNAKKNVG